MLKEVATNALLSLLAVSKNAQKCALEGEHFKMYVKLYVNQMLAGVLHITFRLEFFFFKAEDLGFSGRVFFRFSLRSLINN